MVGAEPWDEWGTALGAESTREEVAGMVESATHRLASLVERAPGPLLARPDAIGEWSMRDCFAHCLVWTEYCAEVLRHSVEGTFRAEDFDYGDEEGFNLRTVREQRPVPVEQLLWRLQQAGAAVAGLVRALPEEEWRARDRYRVVIGGTIVEHFPEHEGQFRSILEAELGRGTVAE